jgi:ribosomal protein S6--L-glutamate ligase
MVHSIHAVKNAIAVLFPEYWQINPLVYALKKRIFPSVPTYHLGHDKPWNICAGI